MEKSAFQFTNPALVRLDFGINEEFLDKCKEQGETEVRLEFSVTTKKKGQNEAEVSLTIKVGEKGAEVPYYIILVEKADFRWRGQQEDEWVTKLLSQNAPSLLLSYARPIISQITDVSPFNTFHIPFMNFTNKN